MIDLNDSKSVIEAAKPFDKSYVDGRGVVMIAGQEIVGFARHLAEDQGLRQNPVGRRASDREMEDLRQTVAEQAARIMYLESALTLAEARVNKVMDERRKQQLPFVGEDKRKS